MKLFLSDLKNLIVIVAGTTALLSSFNCSSSKKVADGGNKANTPVQTSSQNNFSWDRTDTSIALKKNNNIIYQFNFNKAYDKPYFYPLRTGNSEKELLSFRPADHPWHRGLWFSWKLINNINYWEEDVNTRLSDGRSKIDSVSLQLNKDFSSVISIKLSYAPANKPAILTENRSIYISAPDKNGNYYMDWTCDFKAKNDTLIFDRTPPAKFGGPFYGGYAGISIRAAETITNHRYVDSKGWKNSDEVVGHGEKAQWMDLSGTTDSAKNLSGGLAIFDHPSNINSPSPWYVYKDKQFAFFNSSLLFEKPVTLEPLKHMILSYRVLVHEGNLTATALSEEYKKYLAENRKR